MPSRQSRRPPAKVHQTPPGKPTKRGAEPRPSPQADGDSRELEVGGKSSASGSKGATERRTWRRQRDQAEHHGDDATEPRE